MTPTIRVSGVEAAIKGIRKFGLMSRSALDAGMKDATHEAFMRSQIYVPVDRGDLMASGREVEGPTENGQKTFTIEYGGPSAPYALPVHEIPPDRAEHRPPTGWKYLERAVRETKATQERAVRRRMQTEVRGSLT